MQKTRFKNKEEFRQYCKEERKKQLHVRTFSKDKAVNKKLKYLIYKTRAKNVLLYIPLAGEVNILHLLKTLRGKINIYVPFMEGVSFKMVKFRMPLFKKKFNIKEPKNSFAIVPKLDLAVVPVLGVDGALKRVGFGRGMYDRFFESLDYSLKIVFVQLQEQITYDKLCESHDIRADIYITPYKNIIKRGEDDNRTEYSSSRCCSKWGSRLLCGKKIRCSKL